MTTSRANVVSSFTLVKGALVEESYRVLGAWDFALTKRQNLDRLREGNLIGAQSATWLRDVAKVMNRRFDPEGRDRPLVTLAKRGMPLTAWKPLLLWHITRDEFLVRDFLVSWLFEAYEAGAVLAKPGDVADYLRALDARGGKREHAWTDTTSARVAAGLLKLAGDFDLLRGTQRKTFTAYHLPDESFVYLLHAMREELGSAARAIASEDWRMYLMRPGDVERELLRLHQRKLVDYHVAGSLVELGLPRESAADYAVGVAL